jgi:hypothetical protein
MNPDDALLWNHQPAPPRKPQPGERLFEVVRASAGAPMSCELKFHGESYGWECQCLYDGELAYGRRFVLRAHALEEVEAHRTRLLAEGWS